MPIVVEIFLFASAFIGLAYAIIGTHWSENVELVWNISDFFLVLDWRTERNARILTDRLDPRA